MKDIQKETNVAYLFIAHDLSMVRYISDRVGVMHKGHLVETGLTEEIFEHPVHPYTKSLLMKPSGRMHSPSLQVIFCFFPVPTFRIDTFVAVPSSPSA